MTEQSNAELIAEVNEKLASHQWMSDWGIEMLAGILAERLEAADRRAERAEEQRDELNRMHRECHTQRDQYAAVVEKVRGILSHQNRLDEYGVEPLRWAVRKANGILATAPADALREHEAALIEELATEWEELVQREKPPKRGSLWLRDKARQRREERA